MADISQDENMSLHLDGMIIAEGADKSRLSNFVDRCYSKDLDLNLTTSDRTHLDSAAQNMTYQSRLHNLDSSSSIIQSSDLNHTNISQSVFLTIPSSYFQTTARGTIDTQLNLNYFRKNNVSANPKIITFEDYNVTCSNANVNCQFNADLVNNKTPEGNVTIDNNVTHYYGRTHSPRYRFTGASGTAFIYYEVFCNGGGCDRTLLQDGNNSRTTDDPRWFVNEQHTNDYGTAGVITQRRATNITSTIPTGNHPDTVTLTYDTTRGYPYKATMETNSSRWFIYDKYTTDVNKTSNSFEVEFINTTNSWAGAHETDTTTTNTAAPKTNRRSMW